MDMDEAQHAEEHRWLRQLRSQKEQKAQDRRELKLRIVGAILTSLLIAIATLVGTALMVYLGIGPKG